MATRTLGIYPISFSQVTDREYLEKVVYPNMAQEYYWSSDFTADFYIAQAKAGFMAICEFIEGVEMLLPEMQRSYAAIEPKDIHISKKVAKIIKHIPPNIRLSSNLDSVAKKIAMHHKNCWLTSRYLHILNSTKDRDPNFKPISAYIEDNNRIIAGEIGYLIGSTYTSLTGFCIREKRYRNWGKVQMVLLAEKLSETGFSFWNLGHPYMPYKTALGAKIYTREQFLDRWKRETDKKMPQISLY